MFRFPLTIQHDSMQCGIACLQMLCKYYGREYSLAELSKICFATTEGVSLLGISEASTKLGFNLVAGKVGLKELSEAPLPAILHWNQNHFVVLYKVRKHKYYIADPGKGLLVLSEPEFSKSWLSCEVEGEKCGVAMFLETTPKFFDSELRKAPEQHDFKFLFGYFKRYKKYFGRIIVSLAIGSVLQLILPFLTQAVVDVGIEQGLCKASGFGPLS